MIAITCFVGALPIKPIYFGLMKVVRGNLETTVVILCVESVNYSSFSMLWSLKFVQWYIIAKIESTYIDKVEEINIQFK